MKECRKQIVVVCIIFLGFLLVPSLIWADVTGSEQFIQYEQSGLILTYSFDQPQLSKRELFDVEYDVITIPGLENGGDVGAPYLPIQPAYIYIPENRQIKSISVFADEKITIGTDAYIQPCQESQTIGDTTIRPVQYNQKIYASHAEFPGTFYKEVGTFFSRGHKILVLTLYPIQYTPLTGQLDFYSNIQVQIQLSETIDENRFLSYNQYDIQQVRKLIDNPETLQIVSTQNQLQPISSLETDGICEKDDFRYVIITTDIFKGYTGENSFYDLINLNLERGVTTAIVTVEEIMNEPDYWNTGIWGDGDNSIFNDTEARIRNFIKDAYVNWNTRYILLAGDIETTPSRYLYYGVYRYPTNNTEMKCFAPSDVYYTCLDGSYNADEDKLWGELEDDQENESNIDLYSEVFIGRICIDDTTELGYFVNKTINHYHNNQKNLKKVVMAGEILEELVYGGKCMDQLINECADNEVLTIGISDNWYNITKIYDCDWEEHGWPMPIATPYGTSGGWPKEELINQINNNTYFINHLGHSNNKAVLKMNIDDVDNLTNTNSLFIYSQGCLPGYFDFDDCIAEHFTSKNKNGATAVIMNTRLGWYANWGTDGPSHRYHRAFINQVYNNQNFTISEANQHSKEKNIYRIDLNRMLWCFYEITLFGDPLFSIMPQIQNYDIAVNVIDTSEQHIAINSNITIFGDIVNNGYENISNITVNLLVNDEIVDSQQITHLHYLYGVSSSFNWAAPSTAGYYNITLEVNNPYINESNLQNNKKTTTVAVGVLNNQTNKLFNTIQEAISDDSTQDKDLIIIPDGIYYENITMDKSLLLSSYNKEKTIITTDQIQYCLITIENIENASISNLTFIGGDCGIFLKNSSNIFISNCQIYNNTIGILIANSSGKNLVENNIIIKNEIGIIIDSTAKSNIIFYNYFNNTINAVDNGVQNKWNKEYYYNGFRPQGSNYWSDYSTISDNFIGPDQNISGNDGIGDIPYLIQGNATSFDFYPRINPAMKIFPAMVYIDDDNIEGPWIGTNEYPLQNLTAAINVSIEGDSIYIKNGVYGENAIIKKPLKIFGKNSENTIFDNGEITIQSDNVELSGIMFRNSENYAIQATGENITIFKNVFDNNSVGIKAINVINSSIYNNNFTDNNDSSIYLLYSDNNKIFRNYMFGNNVGIYISTSTYNLIFENNISNSEQDGISLFGLSNNNYITNNTFYNSLHGIQCEIGRICQNNITKNNFINNIYGFINTEYSNYNNNIYYNNFISNLPFESVDIFDQGDNNYTKIIKNWYIGGNYYLKYDEPSERAWDNNSDGIIDSPYAIPNTNCYDYLPLAQPMNGTIPVYKPKSVYVDDDNTQGPWNGTKENPYQTIKEALEKEPEQIIINVAEGIYTDYLDITKTVKLIGSDKNTTFIRAGNILASPGITIRSNGVVISGFTIEKWNIGIRIRGNLELNIIFKHNIITNNIIKSMSGYGVDVIHSHYNKIQGNIIKQCHYDGIYIRDVSNSNIISKNTIFGNGRYGIQISTDCNLNKIFYNNILDNIEENAYDECININTLWSDYNKSVGNYWGDYNETDDNADGIGDIPYGIPPHINDNFDHYPLMEQTGWYKVQYIDPLTSQITTTSQETKGLTSCPAGDGPGYEYLQITVLDINGIPIPKLPSTDFIFSVEKDKKTDYYDELECIFTPIENKTDENGKICFEVTADTTIIGNIFISVTIQDIEIENCTSLLCNSFDLNVDGLVDILDVTTYASIEKMKSKKDKWMIDYNWDGKINDLDLDLFNEHLGHTA